MKNCLFCEIVSGKIPAKKVYEDENTLAFLDVSPVNEGHTLVIPKKHIRNIFDISKEDWCAMAEVARKLSVAVLKATGADGINIGVNNEPSAGQVIFHSHIHIIPRFKKDGFELYWHGTPYKDENVMQDLSEKIKSSI